ncbi:MAG: aldehyde dehydrogenase family protein [Planctomycetes bacterium]|nr:aldehyde dehydrogenase family protein [Planctomycetota bacterium]
MRSLCIVNPASRAHVRDVPCDEPGAVAAKLARARAAQPRWHALPLERRLSELRAAFETFRRDKEAIARDVTREMGKPVTQARAEVETLLVRVEYLLSIAPTALASESVPAKPGFELRVAHEPLGVVLDIAAWNYPLIVPINVVLPALAAGNAVVLKHSPKTPAAGEHFARALAGLSEPDAFQHVIVPDSEAGALVADARIDHVCFTGSVATGRRVYRAASERLAGVGLELGGKDPAYVAEDAELAFAAENVVDGACYNAGQSCCAVERAYVHARVYTAFLEHATLTMQAYRLGDPLEETTTMGPLVDAAALAKVEAHVADALARGARLLCGGRRPAGLTGFFYEPTLLADVPDDALVMREETFGPVLPVRAVRDDAEAIERMNDSRYGLTASVWTKDAARAERFVRALEAGTVFQNRCDYLDPALPWTGWKESGLGSTLGRHGFLHLTRRKSVHLRR